MKTGYIAIIGDPNVGKSTLMNRLLETKLSIVTSKPQTTRSRILGILTERGHQCCLLDTPGLITPHNLLQEDMIKHINKALSDADIIIWVVDPWFKPSDVPTNLLEYFSRKPAVCVINKIDCVPYSQLLPVIDTLRSLDIEEIFPISALLGNGVDSLKKVLFKLLPEGPFLYPEEDISDTPQRFFVAELIREKIFERFKKEIPYSSCVVIDEFKEREIGKDFIRALIYVERKSQKQILIGKNGEALKQLGQDARTSIEQFLGRSVYLELWVKVKEKWRKNKKFLSEISN